MHIVILGGGLASVSAAYYLCRREDVSKITILEKESSLGGLCRSFSRNGLTYDIGPHIIFSKNAPILEFMNTLLGDNVSKHRRTNKVFHKKRFVQYPFETDLSSLPEEDKQRCVNGFVNNPYEDYDADNMLQFFLKTFGEGITNLYLRPYNEKIWKFDPAFMNTIMVDRIPKPTREEIFRSANGEKVDGNVHQLFFTYPTSGGIQSLVDSFVDGFNDKVEIHVDCTVVSVSNNGKRHTVQTSKKAFDADRLISTIPVNLLSDIFEGAPDAVRRAGGGLKFNSIALCLVNAIENKLGSNLGFNYAGADALFHRLTRVDFFGESYGIPDTTTFAAEVTYRDRDMPVEKDDETLCDEIITGLMNIGFISNRDNVRFTHVDRFEYAYVIYDLHYDANMKILRDYFADQGVDLLGRFGNFEYLNMDAVIDRSLSLSKRFGAEKQH